MYLWDSYIGKIPGALEVVARRGARRGQKGKTWSSVPWWTTDELVWCIG